MVMTAMAIPWRVTKAQQTRESMRKGSAAERELKAIESAEPINTLQRSSVDSSSELKRMRSYGSEPKKTSEPLLQCRDVAHALYA